MKKIILIMSLILVGCISTTRAQVSMNFGINIGVQPIWGPVGYDYAEYYYFPDMEVYYYIPGRQFIYPYRGRWIFASGLPDRYRTYDLYNCYKVVVNEPRPYLHHNIYHERYSPFRGRRDQAIIRDSREEKYWQIKEHPMHNQWKINGPQYKEHHEYGNKHDNGNHGHNKGRH
jgi:hypothetical protein